MNKQSCRLKSCRFFLLAQALWVLAALFMFLLIPRAHCGQNTYEATMLRAANYRIANNFISAESIYNSILLNNPDDDFAAGVGLVFRETKRLSFLYEGVFSGGNGFAANQRHKTKATFCVFPFTLVGVGADLSHYNSGWVRFARMGVFYQSPDQCGFRRAGKG